MTIFF